MGVESIESDIATTKKAQFDQLIFVVEIPEQQNFIALAMKQFLLYQMLNAIQKFP